jgi:hypothetical protein
VAEAWRQVSTAQGHAPADLLVRNCQIVNVYTAEIHPGDIAIRGGTIVAIRENFRGESLQTIDARGRYAVPGFVIPLLSSESEPALSSGQAFELLGAGATSLILGFSHCADGAVAMPFDFPASEGPSLPGRTWLAPSSGRPRPRPAPLPSCEGYDQILQQLRIGVPPILPLQRSAESWAAVFAGLKANQIDTSRIALGWNSSPAAKGADPRRCLEQALLAALGAGFAPAEAFALVTLNPAILCGLDHLIGSIAPGRLADFLLLEKLDQFSPDQVILNGQSEYAKGGANLKRSA